jgi:hypothetical protein
MTSGSTKKAQLLAVLTLGCATQYICYYFDLGVAIHVCNLITSSSAAFGVARHARKQTSDGPWTGEKGDLRASIPDETLKC